MSHTMFQPLLFGGDINVYSMARAFHEEYGIRSICFGKYPSGPAYDSRIIDYRVCPENEDPAQFRQNVKAVADEMGDVAVLLIACGDSYVKLAAENRAYYPENVVVPYAPAALIEELTDKERFYALCEKHGLPYPKTFIYRRELGEAFDLPFKPPFICKPADGVAYWAHPFEGNEKVFTCADREALLAVLEKVYAAGYPGRMIIQEYIPGDDSYMHVLTNYSDREGKVKLMCLGHVLLEEHTPHGIGNHAVITIEINDELCGKIQRFLEELGYTGFSNFDIKYDKRDNQYKLFEINCRQGRSNYYITGAGYNIAKTLVEDQIEHRFIPFTLADNPSLWLVVPRKVAFDYISSDYHREMKVLLKRKRARNPLKYKPDRGLKRKLRLLKSSLGHFAKFRKYYEKQ